MSGMDAAFLYLDTPTMHMHVVGVVVLDPVGPAPFGTPDVRAAMEARIHLIPPLRRRAVAPPAGIDHPLWVEDPEFDLDQHLARAPLEGPVSWARLEDYVGEVAGRPLDRSRPLWEMWVVEQVDATPVGGSPDRSVALVTKLHHSIMDGAAGGDMMASLFDLTADSPPVPPPEAPWVPDKLPSVPALVVGSLRSMLARQREVPGSVARTFGGLAATARTWVDQRRSGSGVPLTAPRTPINGALTARRAVSLVKVDLDAVREIRRAFSTKVNDVVLAASATALRRWFMQTGNNWLPGEPLVVAVPVSARGVGSEGDGPGSGPDAGGVDDRFGNRVTSMMVSLPLEPDDAVERLRAVHASANASKVLLSVLGTDTLQELTGFTAPSVMTAGVRLYSGLHLANFHRPVSNLIISNVPGPPIDLFCAGARVIGIFPMGPVMEGMGLNVTVLSEADHLNVGVMACPDLVEDVGAIGRYFVEAVDELLAAARARPAG
jgi:WS/DGAT/MGAT family acyltransferase